MYNGIGLQTARGSGTNGFVTKNLSYVRVSKEKVEYKPDEEIKKLEAYINKKGNAELLKHDRKRKIELKCVEMEDLMIEQGYAEEEIASKVEKFRKQLLEKDSLKDEAQVEFEFDQFGRPVATESHKIAEANDLKNRKLREAFGLGEFDPTVKAKQVEEEKRMRELRHKEMLSKKYQWVDEDDLADDDDDEEAYSATIKNRKLLSQVIQVKSAQELAAEAEAAELIVKKEIEEDLENNKRKKEKNSSKHVKNSKVSKKNSKKRGKSTSSSSSGSSNSGSSSSSDSSSSSGSDSSDSEQDRRKKKLKSKNDKENQDSINSKSRRGKN